MSIVYKCKMCGGNLVIQEDSTVCECEYCGSTQTVPVLDDEKKIKLYERANKLRINCDFDKAAGIYENIVAEYPDEAEGYWGLILCRYGIEYVDDPVTGKKIPTCHRSSFDSVMDDEDFDLVMENCDSLSRSIYREEAKYIENIRKGIIEVSGKEEPYDIFICYKESDGDGNRTLDSVLAQDVYDALKVKGYRVFFSRISLEDKLGVEYEPYIFAALNSAKIMLVFGSSYEYFNAVWVKNEWSRYLKLISKDKNKHLIPCFKNVDAYDIPKEFAKLQAQDMGKIGAVQDLLHGIEKLIAPDSKVLSTSIIEGAFVNQGGAQSDALLKRGYMALEDQEWDKAVGFFEQVLDRNAEDGWAYWGEVLSEYKCDKLEQLAGKLFDKLLLKAKKEQVNIDLPDYKKEYLSNYVIMPLFSEEEQNKMFIQFSYESCIDKLKTVIEDNRNDFCLTSDKVFQRASQYADLSLNEKIDELKKKVEYLLNAELDRSRESDNECFLREKSLACEHYEKLKSCLEEVDVIGRENIEKNESKFREDHDRWKIEKKKIDFQMQQYNEQLEQWNREYSEPRKIWLKAKEKYAIDKADLEKKIETLEDEKRMIDGYGAKKRIEIKEQEIMSVQMQLRSLVIPKQPETRERPVEPFLRPEPSISFEEKIEKNNILEIFYSKYLD